MTTVVQALNIVSTTGLRESQAIVDWTPRTVLVPVRPLLSDSVVERLVTGLSRDLNDEPHGCTTWTKAVTKDGYGSLWNGHTEYVHRLVWELEHGPIPTYVRTEEGWKRVVLDHWCHTRDENCSGGRQCQHRRCGRIDHLRLATDRTNARLGRRWSIAA
jgi:hypothetical protein